MISHRKLVSFSFDVLGNAISEIIFEFCILFMQNNLLQYLFHLRVYRHLKCLLVKYVPQLSKSCFDNLTYDIAPHT